MMGKTVEAKTRSKSRRRRRSGGFASSLKMLAMVLLAVACMGTGWYIVHKVMNLGKHPVEQVAVVDNKSPKTEAAPAKPETAPVAPPKVEAKPETPTKPETKPEPKPEAKPTPKPEAKPDPKPEMKPETKPEPKPEPKPDPKPEAKPDEAKVVLFEKDVKPILAAKCQKCHMGANKKNDLDLTSVATIKKGGSGGPGVVPGDLTKGTLWEAVSTNTMPPMDSGIAALTDAEKKIVSDWIKGGAKGSGETVATPPPTKPDETVKAVFYDKQIKNIFTNKCTKCHGDGNIKGKLDMRTMAAMLKGGDSGPALVPNDLEKSSIWTEIKGGSMPPKGEPKLTDAEKQLIMDWIKSGAKASASAAGATADAPKVAAAGNTLSFEKNILPIMENTCATCHNAKQKKNNLQVTSLALLKKGGNGGPAVVPGKLESSLMWIHIDGGQMPPEGSGSKLSDTAKETIKNWILAGAKDNAMVAAAKK